MSGLTREEEERIKSLFTKMSQKERDLTLATEESFGRWLKGATSWIWDKIKTGIKIFAILSALFG